MTRYFTLTINAVVAFVVTCFCLVGGSHSATAGPVDIVSLTNIHPQDNTVKGQPLLGSSSNGGTVSSANEPLFAINNTASGNTGPAAGTYDMTVSGLDLSSTLGAANNNVTLTFDLRVAAGLDGTEGGKNVFVNGINPGTGTWVAASDGTTSSSDASRINITGNGAAENLFFSISNVDISGGDSTLMAAFAGLDGISIDQGNAMADLLTGTVTSGNNPSRVTGLDLNFNIENVPEPASILMSVLLGTAVLGWQIYRGRGATA